MRRRHCFRSERTAVAVVLATSVLVFPGAASANSVSYTTYAGYGVPQLSLGSYYMQVNYCLFAQGASTLASTQGLFRIVMQTDANVVEYDTSNDVMWDSAAHGGKAGQPTANYRLCIQGDGNLVEYTPSNGVLWASNTGGHSCSCSLVIQNDGNVVDYNGSVALWSDGGEYAVASPFKEVDAAWNVRSVAGTPNLYVWPGMEGKQYTGSAPGSIIQGGSASVNGSAYFWYEDYPYPIQTMGNIAVLPGDEVYVSVSNINANTAQFAFFDYSYLPAQEYTFNYGPLPYPAAVQPEAIEEDTSATTYTNGGTVSVTANKTPSSASSPTPFAQPATQFNLVQGGIQKATTGPLDSSGDFSISYIRN
jgi:hypothetical protein